ncbi:MAG TPA: hypothetical protein VNI57_15910, partial [Candidatus Saccharimonadales bacterium]|nr:hypothetical protein [Candidatus Saccharimonadales bacterium]
MRAFLTLVVVLALALGYMAGQAWPLSPVLPVSAPPAVAASAPAAVAPPAAGQEKAPPEGLTSGEQRVIDVFRTA